jgi:hypothetical protein
MTGGARCVHAPRPHKFKWCPARSLQEHDAYELGLCRLRVRIAALPKMAAKGMISMMIATPNFDG